MDIRLINLYRRSIKEPKIGGTGQNFSTAQSFFATDYFDELRVNKMTSSDSLPDILGISTNNQRQDEEDVAVQSYAIYSCSDIIKIKANKNMDLFEDDSEFPYLSIIQAHITPEVLSKLYVEPKDFNNSMGIIQYFAADLNEVITEFAEKAAEEVDACYCRIYYMLASGDFAVIIRSKQPETSFKLSTCMRRRMAVCRNQNGDLRINDSLAIYKTYTLLTMKDICSSPVSGGEVINTEGDSGLSENKNRFVIRCCFSNKYWQSHDEKELRDKGIEVEKITSKLYGRYDFAMELSEEDFRSVYPYLRQYKSMSSTNSELSSEIDNLLKKNASEPKIYYLLYLLHKKYLSYVNERLLLDYQGVKNNIRSVKTFSKKIFLDEEKINNPELYEANRKKNIQIQKLFEKVISRMMPLPVYHQKLRYYMLLLQKLVRLCNMINESSDIRISVVMLLEQLQIALDSMEAYISIYNVNKDEGILEFLEVYLRITVSALNSFAENVRNNNLQTLQTPNYNIETGSSMEKVLVSFSEFLRTLTEYYNANSGQDTRDMHPIVVPQLKEQDLSVEIMFPDGMSVSWEEEKEIRENRANKYLMVVTSPTLREIGNATILLPLVLHELAHQFRYESREERNDTLLRIAAEATVTYIVDGIQEEIENVGGLTDTGKEFLQIAQKVLAEKLIECFFAEGGKPNYTYRDAPLEFFKYRFKEDIMYIFEEWDYGVKLKKIVIKFFESIRDLYQVDEKALNDCIIKVYDTLKEAENLRGDINNIESDREGIQQCVKKLRNEMNKYKIALNTLIDNEVCEVGEKKFLQDKIEGFYGVARVRLDNYDMDAALRSLVLQEKREKYLAEVYKQLSLCWAEKLQIIKGGSTDKTGRAKSESDYREWSGIGRLFGIDYKSKQNRELFEKKMVRIIGREKTEALERAENVMSVYREETSDLFMYCVMGLEPYGYLNLMINHVFGDGKLSETREKRIGDLFTLVACKELLESDIQCDAQRIRKECFMPEFLQIANRIPKELETGLSCCFEKPGEPFSEQSSSMYIQKLREICESIKVREEPGSNKTDSLFKSLEEYANKLHKCHQAICDLLSGMTCDDDTKFQAEKCLELVEQGLNMTKAMRILDVNVMKFAMRFLDNKEYFSDLYKGYKKYAEIAVKMQNTQEADIKCMKEECAHCAKLLNMPYVTQKNILEGNETEDTVESSIKFWNSMYYKGRLHYARDMGEVEGGKQDAR